MANSEYKLYKQLLEGIPNEVKLQKLHGDGSQKFLCFAFTCAGGRGCTQKPGRTCKFKHLDLQDSQASLPDEDKAMIRTFVEHEAVAPHVALTEVGRQWL